MTTEEILELLRADVNKRIRFVDFDMMVPVPTEDELDCALFDALDDINTEPPQTFFSLETVYTSTDTRWKRLLCMGAIYIVLDTMITELTANGLDVQIAEFTVSGKMGELAELRNYYKERFLEQAAKLKRTSSFRSRYRPYRTTIWPVSAGPTRRFSTTYTGRWGNF